MTDLDPDNVVEAIRFMTSGMPATDVPVDYQIGDCARRTVHFSLSTHRRYESWSGVRTQGTEIS
jgi:UDP-N-acetylglucosamine 2-epimerase (non-hydrolysing)